jgi:predicted RNA polymerase sigma factor
LLTRLGRANDARAELTQAMDLCDNQRERALLQRKVVGLR